MDLLTNKIKTNMNNGNIDIMNEPRAFNKILDWIIKVLETSQNTANWLLTSKLPVPNIIDAQNNIINGNWPISKK